MTSSAIEVSKRLWCNDRYVRKLATMYLGGNVLRIFVVSQNGVPPAMPLSAEFGEGVGSIGREEHNTLALPDPLKHISRVQAQIKCADGKYLIIDQGGNPTSVNGRPLGKGNSVSLLAGDSIEMADWVLRIEVLRAPPTFSTPLPATSDPLGLQGGPAPASSPVAAPHVLPAASSAPVRPPEAFGPSSASDDPFDIFLATSNLPSSSSTPTPLDTATNPFDAFGAPEAPPVQPASAQACATDPLGLGLVQASQGSVDSIFGLPAQSAADPFANSALADPMHQAHTHVSGAGADPMALLMGSGAAPGLAVARNDSSLLNDAFIPPQAAKPVVSWDTSTEVSTESDPQPAFALTEQQPILEKPIPSAIAERSPVVDRPAAPPPNQGMPATCSPDALLAGFLRGLNVPNLNPPEGFTPELAEHVGAMFREAVQGTVELLVARAATKREVRAEMTMIVSKNNNPLKFSPDVNFALFQLLQPGGGKGFMPPVDAMRDAYDDLRAHQLGFIAGMRAALAGVLARFKPEILEARLSDKSFLDSVLPANRKAKLWDLYEKRFADILGEAEDDFHSLFGREFLRAYEEQIDRMQNNNNSRT